MIKQQEKKLCQLCESPLKGRSDKKFCDDYCRAAYNNELRGVNNNLVRNINNALRRNRQILENMLQKGGSTIKTNRDKLVEKGFLFKYYTQQYQAKNGKIYFYCYEYGYMPLENNWFLIVKKREE